MIKAGKIVVLRQAKDDSVSKITPAQPSPQKRKIVQNRPSEFNNSQQGVTTK